MKTKMASVCGLFGEDVQFAFAEQEEDPLCVARRRERSVLVRVLVSNDPVGVVEIEGERGGASRRDQQTNLQSSKSQTGKSWTPKKLYLLNCVIVVGF